MKSLLCLVLTLLALGASVAYAHDKSAPLTDAQKLFLGQYESVRVALAADDLAAAKKAAQAIVASAPAEAPAKEGEAKHTGGYMDAAKTLSTAGSLESARDAFKTVSKRAVHFAGSQKGFYHAHCPMVPNEEGDWVQTTKKISNPYMGKAMATCGSIEK